MNKNFLKNNKKFSKRNWEVFGEITGAVIGILISIYLVPKFNFITPDYYQWLPTAIVITIFNAAIESVGHLNAKTLIKPITKIISLALTAYSIILLLNIFPFDFSIINKPQLNSLIRIILYISLIGMLISAVINFIKFNSLSKKN